MTHPLLKALRQKSQEFRDLVLGPNSRLRIVDDTDSPDTDHDKVNFSWSLDMPTPMENIMNPIETLPKLEGSPDPYKLDKLKERQVAFCKTVIKGYQVLLDHIDDNGAIVLPVAYRKRWR